MTVAESSLCPPTPDGEEQQMRSINQKKRLTQRGAAMVQIMMLVGLMGLVAGGAMLGVKDQLGETAKSGDESMEASTLGTNRGVSNAPMASLSSQNTPESNATSENQDNNGVSGEGAPCLKPDGTQPKAGESCNGRGFWESLLNVTVSGVKSTIVSSDDFNRAGGEGVKETVSDIWKGVTDTYDCATSETCRDKVAQTIEDGYDCATDTECIKETADKVVDWADKAVDQLEEDVIAASDVVDSGDQQAIDEMHGKFVGKALTEVAVAVVGGGVAKGLKGVAKLPGGKGKTDKFGGEGEQGNMDLDRKPFKDTGDSVLEPGEKIDGKAVNATPDNNMATNNRVSPDGKDKDDWFVYGHHGDEGVGLRGVKNHVDAMEEAGLQKNQPVVLNVCHGAHCVKEVNDELVSRGHDKARVIGNENPVMPNGGVWKGGKWRESGDEWVDSNPTGKSQVSTEIKPAVTKTPSTPTTPSQLKKQVDSAPSPATPSQLKNHMSKSPTDENPQLFGKSATGSSVAKSAEVVAADKAASMGKKSGAASAFSKDGKVITAVSGEKTRPNGEVTGALMGNKKASNRSPFHGGCGEVGCLDKAKNDGIDVKGGHIKTVNVGTSGKGHGTPKKACKSCQDVMDYFGVTYDK